MDFFLSHPVFTTYLFLRLDGITKILDLLSFVTMFSSIIAGAVALVCFTTYRENKRRYHEADLVNDLEDYELAKRGFKWVIAVSLIIWTLNLALPSKKDAAIMIGVGMGASLVEAVKDSPMAAKAQQALMSYVDDKLDEIIDENLKKGKKNDDKKKE